MLPARNHISLGGPSPDRCIGSFREEISCGPVAGADGLAVEI
jgi:hypothetical protein